MEPRERHTCSDWWQPCCTEAPPASCLSFRQRQLRQTARRRIHCLLPLLVAYVCFFGTTTAESPCPLQKLVRARPADLGVTHAQILGKIRNNETLIEENVIIHAFIKISRMVSGNTHLYGIGWVEGYDAGKEIEFMPEHLPYINHIPHLTVWAIDSVGEDLEGPFPVTVTHGSVIDTMRMGFRLECVFQSRHQLFQIRVGQWARRYALHTRNVAQPGTLLPWYKYTSPGGENAHRTSRHGSGGGHQGMTGRAGPSKANTDATSAGAGYDMVRHAVRGRYMERLHGGGLGPVKGRVVQGVQGSADDPLLFPEVNAPPEVVALHNRVPLVVVMTLAFSPQDVDAAHEHYAQQLIRHAEYHLDELGMQRVIVYAHEGLFLTRTFHDYVARHLPAHLVPYVTFVAWNEFFMIQNPWYDQYVKYFHGVVALWGYGGALAALIDIDEYIAYPTPHATLHEALIACNATHLDWVRLTNQMIICDNCHPAYHSTVKRNPLGGGDKDLQLWASCKDPAAHEKPTSMNTIHEDDARSANVSCRWWKKDPLKRYTKLWNDRWFTRLGEVPPSQLGTLPAYVKFQGKHMIRGEATTAFMHHRAELMPGRYRRWLDPNTCPYIAHLVHLNGFRPKRWGAKLDYFAKPERAANWFILGT